MFAFLYLLGFAVSAPALAQDPPDRTFATVQEVDSSGVEVQLVELLPSIGKARSVLRVRLPGTVVRNALIGATSALVDPMLAVIDDLTHAVSLIRSTARGPIIVRVQGIQGRAITSEGMSATVADRQNILYRVDPQGQATPIFGSIDPNRYGLIQALQWGETGRLHVLTQNGILTLEAGTHLGLKILNWLDLSGRGLGKLEEFTVGSTHARVLTLQSGGVEIVPIELGSWRVSAPHAVGNADILLLDANNQRGQGDLYAMEAGDYVRYDLGGRRHIEAQGVFSVQKMQALGLFVAAPSLAGVTVSHEKRDFAWQQRPDAAALAAQSAQWSNIRYPMGYFSPAPSRSDPAHAEAEVVAEVEGRSGFYALLTQALGSVRVGRAVTLELLCSRINQTDKLRLYFQAVSPEQLATVGLRRQAYFVRPLVGREGAAPQFSDIAEVLATARADEAARTCAPKLGE